MSAARKTESLKRVAASTAPTCQTLKRDVNQVPYDVPGELEAAIDEFVAFYSHRRYHKALRDITPADMLAGRRDEILGRRKEVKDRTINRRRLSNYALREHFAPA